MSLGVFPPLEFYEIFWKWEVLALIWMFGKIPLWSHPVQGFSLFGVFLIAASMSLGIICLLRFSDSSWFIFGRLYISRNLSISSRLSSLLAYNCSHIFLQSFVFLWCQLFLLFLFWFHIFGSFLFFSSWVWLKVCQSHLSF